MERAGGKQRAAGVLSLLPVAHCKLLSHQSETDAKSG